MNKKIYSYALGALACVGLAACSNDLKEPGAGAAVGQLKLAGTPKVIAWSGDQVLGNDLLGTRGYNANANEWADPDHANGGWVVPPELTEGQIERVKAFFQANPNLGYTDPQWKNFFVQQVYKGYTSPGNNSDEFITSANGSTTTTSDNMNLMTVGPGNGEQGYDEHIYDFNNGTGKSKSILDNGSTIQEPTYHEDMISLMVDIENTSCFGYQETTTNKHHNDKAALVSFEEIEAWAAKNGNPGASLNDGWNRSFLGFDLELLTAPDMKEAGFAKYQDGVQQPNYIWTGTEVIQVAKSDESTNYQPVPFEGYEYLKGPDGNPLPFLITNENQYAASDKVVLEQSEVKIDKQIKVDTEWGLQDRNVACLNMEKIQQLINDGYLPVKNKSLCEWVKIEGSDGYYSDWIVCLTEAKKIGEQPGQPEQPEEPTVNPCPKVENGELGCEHGASSHDGEGYCEECKEEGKTDSPCYHDDVVVTPDPEDPENPDPETPETPGSDRNLPDAGSEVEVNLALGENPGMNGNIKDFVSKLSIHVRHAGDVKVFIPVPAKYYIEADDLAIFQIHEFNHSAHGGPYKVTYTLQDKEDGPYTVTLSVAFEEGGIRITTDGITEEVINFCYKHYKDGINFEIYNYFYREIDGEEVDIDELKNYLDQATIEFLDDVEPNYYINAYYEKDESAYDCNVSIKDNQSEDFYEAVEGNHINDASKNKIYKNKSVEDNDGVEHGHDFMWNYKPAN